MCSPDIEVPDVQRVLIGHEPWSFLIEVAIRGLITYGVLLAAMRLMGTRMAGSPSVSDLAVIVTLGAIAGTPMLTPERGILPTVVLLALAIAIERGLSRLAFRHQQVEVVARGEVATLVRDGLLELDEMRSASISRERLFASLRDHGVMQLGEVRRAYLETSGRCSVFRRPRPVAGLSVMPHSDREWRDHAKVAAGRFVCASCGRVEAEAAIPETPCPRCRTTAWEPAVEGQCDD